MRMRLTNRELVNRAQLARLSAPRPRDGNGWYRLTNLAGSSVGTAELYIYDEIGMWGVTASELVRELQNLEAVHINLRINSEGGDVWDGIAIYNALCNHSASVTTYIDGLAASSASFIAQSGGRVLIARNGTMMIHDASGICFGNAADMSEMAELLDRTSNNIADIYAQRCSTVNVWRKAMKNVSWYVGQEAVNAGLADEAYEPEQGTDGAPTEKRRRATNTTPLAVVNRRVPKPVSTACPSHETETTDVGDWDDSTEQGRLSSPMTVATARKMYGWYDSSRIEDGELPKDACSLPHHTVSEDGVPGPAHLSGVRDALSSLSQSDIPSEEQDAVREHLNKHLEDGGGSPSEDKVPIPIHDSTGEDVSTWWSPDVFKAAVGTAASLNSLYGFNPDMFREAIRSVVEDMPAVQPPAPEARELEPVDPTITLRQFEDAIKRGLL